MILNNIICEPIEPDFLFYIGILAGILATSIPIYQFFEEDIENRNFQKKGSYFAISFAGIISIIILNMQWNDKKNEDNKRCLSEKKLEIERHKADSLQKMIYLTTIKNSTDLLSASNDLHQADKQIINLQSELNNQYTGGNKVIPILQVTTSRETTLGNTGLEYFVISFSLSNPSIYPLQNVRANISDKYSIDLLELGIKPFRNELSYGYRQYVSPDEINSYTWDHPYSIGTLGSRSKMPVYTATIVPQKTPYKDPYYFDVTVQWNDKQYRLQISLGTEKDMLNLIKVVKTNRDVTTFLDLKNYSKYIVFNHE